MRRRHLFLITAALTLAAFMPAQQATVSATHSQGQPQSAPALLERQMQSLSAALDLTPEQKVKTRSILEELDKALAKASDPTLSKDERMAIVGPAHYKAHDQAIAILSDEQKEKLERFMQSPHPEFGFESE